MFGEAVVPFPVVGEALLLSVALVKFVLLSCVTSVTWYILWVAR